MNNRGNIINATLLASALLGLLTTFGLYSLTDTSSEAKMELTPTASVVSIGNTIDVSVTVTSEIPVNAFTGIITFDDTKLAVEKIDYNTSIADLWAEEPWYKNGNGTIHFAGGTTEKGGFTGSGSLLNVTFVAKETGDTTMSLQETAILKHDGFGTPADLATPIDNIFTITPKSQGAANTTLITVRSETNRTDLNNDGKNNLADISLFLGYYATKDQQGDINGDGTVSLIDASLLLNEI